MNPLPNIPTPPRVVLREFRYRFLPPIVFLGTLGIVAVLWRDVTNVLNMIGVAEGARCMVASPQPTLIQQVLVMPYQIVNKGDPIAVLTPVDPRAKTDLLNTELRLAQLRLQPSLAEQGALDYERLRVDLLRTKSEIAVARVNLERAENDLRRNTPLYRDQLVSEEIYDLSLKTRDLYKAEIEEKSQAVVEIERRLAGLSNMGEPDRAGTVNPLSNVVERLEQLQADAATNWGTITLTAPISGMVGATVRQAGECLMEGEPLVTISSLTSDRLVGYLRQPYPVDPKPGMAVQITTRSPKRLVFMSEIAQVGAQVETITNSLAYIRQGVLMDVGLPVVVKMPDNAQIRPGEAVDMLIKAPKEGSESMPATEPEKQRTTHTPLLGFK